MRPPGASAAAGGTREEPPPRRILDVTLVRVSSTVHLAADSMTANIDGCRSHCCRRRTFPGASRAVLSDDGRWVAGISGPSVDVWNATTGARVAQLPHQDPFRIVFSITT